MKQNIITYSIMLVGLAILGSCSNWTEMEAIENKVNKPSEQDPILWAKYTAALRNYKQSEHFIVYARLNNSPKPASSEQNFMRCLPDSLDFVSLTNADNFSPLDAQDMILMRQKGTRVLYQVDYAARSNELNDATKLGAYLDMVIASVKANSLDGYSFTGQPLIGDQSVEDAAKLIVEKLSADDSKVLAFEGNPLFVAEADRSKIDLYILNTERIEHVLDVKLQLINAMTFAKIPASKLLLAAEAESRMVNEERVEFTAIDELSRRVISFGPIGGLATYNIAKDYYHSDMNYKTIRTAIQTLNPSK